VGNAHEGVSLLVTGVDGEHRGTEVRLAEEEMVTDPVGTG
jgi:hypothetical protein